MPFRVIECIQSCGLYPKGNTVYAPTGDGDGKLRPVCELDKHDGESSFVVDLLYGNVKTLVLGNQSNHEVIDRENKADNGNPKSYIIHNGHNITSFRGYRSTVRVEKQERRTDNKSG